MTNTGGKTIGAGQLWSFTMAMNLQGNDFNIQLQASEQSVLTMLRAAYGQFESMLKEAAISGSSGTLPGGFIDDTLILLRCLVFNKLQPHNGRHVKIKPAKAG